MAGARASSSSSPPTLHLDEGFVGCMAPSGLTECTIERDSSPLLFPPDGLLPPRPLTPMQSHSSSSSPNPPTMAVAVAVAVAVEAEAMVVVAEGVSPVPSRPLIDALRRKGGLLMDRGSAIT